MMFSQFSVSSLMIAAEQTVDHLSIKKNSKSTTDHTKLKALQGPFKDGPAVTKACLSCHNKAGEQFIHNKHWTWKYTHPITGQKLGKSRLVNNFCTNARGNEGMCAQCHAGYGLTNAKTFNFNNQNNIDCLVCHESTGSYYKAPPSKGNKACSVMFAGNKAIDWTRTAQSVGMPGRNNCGSCHFFGGGGDNVKHGDLSSALFHPKRDVDVHMSEQGANFACVTCHVGEGHEWAGSRYNLLIKDKTLAQHKAGMPRQTASCASCHGERPHPTSLKGIKLNDHTARVACQTCHIPSFAKGGVATKTHWDWRTAGRLRNGEAYNEEGYIQGNGEARLVYKSIKGSFKYAEDVIPSYLWANGVSQYTLIDTHFDATNPVEINHIEGSANDPDSRIYPFKVMHTIQPYDKVNQTLVYMHLWGDDKDALWGNFNFGRAISYGMQENGIPYSGEYGFIETRSYWPITHMVAPKEQALNCQACHSSGGRLEGLAGVYMPGRDRNTTLEHIGIYAVLAVLIAVLAHGMLRLFMMIRRRKSL